MTPNYFSLEHYQVNTSNDNEPIAEDDISYFRQTFKNKAYQQMMAKFAQRAKKDGWTKATIAQKLNKDPAQITRFFAGPKNWTLDTLSDIALALDFEPDISFGDLRNSQRTNYAHDWTASSIHRAELIDLQSFEVSTGTNSGITELQRAN